MSRDQQSFDAERAAARQRLLLWQMDGLRAVILCQFGKDLCYTVHGSRDALMSCSSCRRAYS